jgi:threonine/homoserine/homoserine lactone efflux protein
MTGVLPAFCLVAAGFVAVPGPSNLFVAARSAQHGVRTAVAGAAGVATGSLLYVLATAAGLAALLASSATATRALHYAGAVYLAWLGVRHLRTGTMAPDRGSPRGRAYRQGLVVELANPKVALFFMALLPQFVRPGAGPAALQLVVLGVAFVSLGLASDCLYAALAHRIAIRRGRAIGLVYVGLAGWTAASGP